MKDYKYTELDEIPLGGLYVIQNMVNGKFYVGSAKNFWKRWVLHRHLLNNNKHHSPYLQNSWNKYGEEAFTFLPLQCVADKQERLKLEQHFLDTLKPEYNGSPTATSCEGIVRSEATREKLRVAMRDPKRLARITEMGKQPKSEEHKKNISEAHIGMKASEETCAKLREAWKSRRQKMIENPKPKRIVSEETKQKQSFAKKGKNKGRTWKIIDSKRIWMDK
jgi:group I intron endonuclease